MKRKFIIFLLAIISVFAIALCCSACVNSNSQDKDEGSLQHNHNFSESVATIDATCTENGYALYSCACGEVKVNTIDALGHDYEDHSAKAASCYEDGWEEYQTCSRCDYTTLKSIPAPNEHSYYVDGYCERCGDAELTPNALVFTLKEDNTYEVAAMFKTIQQATIPSIFKGKSVTSIAANAFDECTLLENIFIPDSIISIGDEAFGNCNELKSITIPDSVTSIGFLAFNGCTSLNAVYITDIVSWCNISFGLFLATPLYYAHNLYLNGKLVTELKIPSGITSIGYEAFRGCFSLESITIPASVVSIGTSAFVACINLTNVTFENNSKLTVIDGGAFADCTSLKSIVIPDGVISIGGQAFADCTSLESITIPASVASIGEAAFYDCTSLDSITIPVGVASIGGGAFGECLSLAKVYYGGTVEQWSQIDIDWWRNENLENATRYYYSEEYPFSGEVTSGNFWHYDENGEIAVWNKK